MARTIRTFLPAAGARRRLDHNIASVAGSVRGVPNRFVMPPAGRGDQLDQGGGKPTSCRAAFAATRSYGTVDSSLAHASRQARVSGKSEPEVRDLFVDASRWAAWAPPTRLRRSRLSGQRRSRVHHRQRDDQRRWHVN
jgi:hypothetical protein